MSMKKIPYVHSSYARIPDDNYQTIDQRCVDAFLKHYDPVDSLIVDVCAPNGSGIVERFQELGYNAVGCKDAFMSGIKARWIVTNPPYKKGLVDRIMRRQIKRIKDGEVIAVAALLRTNFDHAKGRTDMFDSVYYYGQIKMRFRPWWSVERKASPIHNYVWHIWRYETLDYPIVLYA